MEQTDWSKAPTSELKMEVASRTWFHTIDLGDGVVTPGHKNTLSEVDAMRLPASLGGQTVLDIGAYDGFYSFEAERRGAARVVAADKWSWNWPGSDARQNFELAHSVLDSRVETVEVSVEDLSPATATGTFDLVLFLGILYHAPDPLGYLERVHSVTSGLAIVETLVDLLDVKVPALGYYAGDSLNADASNHFGPNPAAVEGLLKDAGFSRVKAFAPWQSSRDWALEAARPSRNPLERVARRLRRVRSGRMVFHAWA
jgi:tRNA (mo5U34)-methyltransferase